MYPAVTKNDKNICGNISAARRLQGKTLASAIVRGAMTLAVISALLIAARPAQSQTQEVLYNFQSNPDGASPSGPVTYNNGNLFGTTYIGGAYGNGSVFELTPNGSGGWNEKVLYSFCPASPSCTDGANPAYSSVIFDKSGNLYGTAYNGGSSGNGVVFKLTPSGSSWTESVVYNFADTPDDANPINGLVVDSKGNFYGTTYAGGALGNGSVFEMSPSGANWTEKVIANINSNGSGLAINSAGYIFGTSYALVFALVPTASGSFNEYTLFTFNPSAASKEGSNPAGTVAVDSSDNVYGTTLLGGTSNQGVVYKLSEPTKGAAFKESIIAEFGTKIGEGAVGGLIVDSSGNLYGTSEMGGRSSDGTVYELSPTGTGTYTQTVLVIFSGYNGAAPTDELILNGGYLYGTTSLGGADGSGTVFISNPKANVTTTTITSSLNPSTYGQAVTFTATVTSPNGPPPNGEVVVFQPIGQSTITNGVATFTLSDLNPGPTKITAVYGGDLNFITSQASLVQTVNK
jgi:uncharacterized repeat protein (TIGR03803 family)